jgi:hypothetical protein
VNRVIIHVIIQVRYSPWTACRAAVKRSM